MKNLKIGAFALTCISLMGANAFAGEKSGNGGVVFLCPDRVKLVDFWESQDLRNLMSIGDRNASLETLTNAYLERLEFFDEMRASGAKAFAATVLNDLEALAQNPNAETELVRFTDGPLNFSLDSDEVNVPPGCEKAQAVTQKQPEIDGEKLLTIYRPIWDRMDNEMRVFTIFHEINIRALIELRTKKARRQEQAVTPLTSTRPARLLNQWIGSSRFARTKTVCDYLSAESRFGILDVDQNTYGGFNLSNAQPEALKCDSATHRLVFAPGATRIIPLKGANNASESICLKSPVFAPNSPQWLSAGVIGVNYFERTFNPKAPRWDYDYFDDAIAKPQVDGSILVDDIRRMHPYGSLVSIFHGGNRGKDRLLGTAELGIFPDGKIIFTPHN